MVQCYTLLNFSVLLSYFAAELLGNFGLLGIHAVNTNVTCQACPKGTFGNNSVPGCQNCTQKGWCEKTSFCVQCPAGYFQNVTGKTGCQPCPVGHYQEEAGMEMCHPCKKGTAQDKQGQKACSDCQPGEYQDNSGEVKCKPCRKGFYSKTIGSLRCISCPYGEYCDKPGCQSCSGCPPGQEADNMGSKNCTFCEKGYVKAGTSSDVCNLCPQGWYQDKIGQTTCNKCPKGYYCPWQDEPPVPCDPKAVCPAGSWKPNQECKGLYIKNKDTENCELSSIVYAVIGVVLAVIVAGIGFVAVRRRHKRDNEQKQRLLERQHPVYTGW